MHVMTGVAFVAEECNARFDILGILIGGQDAAVGGHGTFIVENETLGRRWDLEQQPLLYLFHKRPERLQ